MFVAILSYPFILAGAGSPPGSFTAVAGSPPRPPREGRSRLLNGAGGASRRYYASAMDGASLVRVRWRLRGAWRWPAFIGLIVADAVLGHALPPVGEAQSVPAAALDGLMLNLVAVLLLTRPVGALIRRRRRDLPTVVARDYAATWVVLGVTAVFLAAGLAHRSSVQSDQAAMQEATARAQAWIGDRAPPEFRRRITRLSLLEIQAGRVYRACATSATARTFCVVVDVKRPWGRSVRFAGYEPNSMFSQGLG